MHDIWNPWHGCKKISEGCLNCYMYTLDKRHGKDGAMIYKTKSAFQYPLSKNRRGEYKIKSGELIRLCMTSDFFMEEADEWRPEVWKIIRQRSDVKFFILTKRAQRIQECLPEDWGQGYENVILNVTCENQERAEERIPILLSIPAKHKGIMCAPLLGPITILKYLQSGQLEQVICGGENYEGARPCHYEWVKSLYLQCRKHGVTFNFIETGNIFIKGQNRYQIPSKLKQSQLAYKSRLQYQGKPISFLLTKDNEVLQEKDLYVLHYREHCITCGTRMTCNGCSDCGRCQERIISKEEMDVLDTYKYIA